VTKHDPIEASRTLLISLSGRDRPGVSSALFSALDQFHIAVIDVEQVTIRGRLVLGTLISAPDATQELELRDAVANVAASFDLECQVQASQGPSATVGTAAHVTIIGNPLTPGAIAAIATAIAGCGANIDRISRMASRPVTAIEMEVSGADPATLQGALAYQAVEHRVDIAVQRGGLARRAKRLIVMDVDSTLIENEVIDLLARQAGVEEEVAAITEQAMLGELDFAQSLQARVRLLKGLSTDVFAEVQAQLVLTPGARTLISTLQRLDHRIGVVSGGFIEVIKPLVDSLGIDFVRANSLAAENGRLTGQLLGDIVDRPGKATALREFAALAGVHLEQCVAIGDGANDLDMLELAGLGIAFNAKQIVRDRADTSFTHRYLDSVLYLLGISQSEFLDLPAS
jgi:phosphoserine phosphatase